MKTKSCKNRNNCKDDDCCKVGACECASTSFAEPACHTHAFTFALLLGGLALAVSFVSIIYLKTLDRPIQKANPIAYQENEIEQNASAEIETVLYVPEQNNTGKQVDTSLQVTP